MQPHATTSFQNKFDLLERETVMNMQYMFLSVPMLISGAVGIFISVYAASLFWILLCGLSFLLGLLLLFQQRNILFNRSTRTLRTETRWLLKTSVTEFYPDEKSIIRIDYSYSIGLQSIENSWYSTADYSHFEVFIYNNPARKYFLKEFTEAQDARRFAKKMAGILNVGYKSKIIIKGLAKD